MQPSWQTMKHSILNPSDKRVITVIIILMKWTAYCLESHIRESYGDHALLDCNQPKMRKLRLQ